MAEDGMLETERDTDESQCAEWVQNQDLAKIPSRMKEEQNWYRRSVLSHARRRRQIWKNRGKSSESSIRKKKNMTGTKDKCGFWELKGDTMTMKTTDVTCDKGKCSEPKQISSRTKSPRDQSEVTQTNRKRQLVISWQNKVQSQLSICRKEIRYIDKK